MSKRFVRITCRERGTEGKEYDIVLDAVLDGDKMLALPWFGAANYPNGKYPFRLDTKGRADFGYGYEDSDRYWDTKLRDRAIRPGESFSVNTADDSDFTYVIREVEVILRGELVTPDVNDFELGDGSELDLDDPDVCHAISMAKRD